MNQPQVKLLGNLVGVEKAVKHTEKENSLFVKNPEISDKYGTVKYLGESAKDLSFNVGDKVYYGSKVELVRMAGADIYVMEPTNVIALIEEASEEASA